MLIEELELSDKSAYANPNFIGFEQFKETNEESKKKQ